MSNLNAVTKKRIFLTTAVLLCLTGMYGTRGSVYASENKLVTAIVTDSFVTVSANGGFMPSLFYREHYKYVCRYDRTEHILQSDKPAIHPETERAFSEDELEDILYYLADNGDLIERLYTRQGELITDPDGAYLENVNVGDTVFTLTKPKKMIVVDNPEYFSKRPLSLNDELRNKLHWIRDRYSDAIDIDRIIIALEREFRSGIVSEIENIARCVGFVKVDYAKLASCNATEQPAVSADMSGIGGYSEGIDEVLSGISSSGNGKRRITGIGSDTRHFQGDKLVNGLISSEGSGQKTTPTNSLRGAAPTGGRSRGSIQGVVMQNVTALRYSYSQRLHEVPELEGKVTVKFAINESGNVIFAEVTESTTGDPEFDLQIIGRVKTWNFGRINIPGDVTEVVYPFYFKP
ncbi:biopolymer transporter TonB [Chitinispirillum alkaliphilum]|nr:biopolymer transporter TonB [Chitinispirillum alkaliphilum]